MGGKGSRKDPHIKKSLGTSEEPGVKELVPEKEKTPLDDLNKPTPGEELLKRLKKEKEEAKVEKKDDYVGEIIDGVEVVDVKAIPTGETKLAVPEKRKTWDKP